MIATLKKILRAIFIGGIICGSFLLSGAQALEVAQIEPAKNRLIIPPGTSKSGSIKIYNLSGEPKKIQVYLEDWVYLPICDGTKDFKPGGTTPLSAAKWITFLPSELTVPAYGRQLVNYTVKVPADAKGGHYAVLFFQNYLQEPQKTSEGVNVNVAVRVASLFYIEPAGTINRKVSIDRLKMERQAGKWNISAKFNNLGNADINTKGTFFLIDQKGMVYARGEFNEVYTFGGDSANLIATWKGAIPDGTYDLVMTIDIGKALEDAGLGRIPALTREATLTILDNGDTVKIGEFK